MNCPDALTHRVFIWDDCALRNHAHTPKTIPFSGFLFAMENQTLINIDSVSKQYGNMRDGVLALRDVSLNIRSGEFLTIIGPSGCGKSTLLRMIGDLLPPSAGQISIDGKTPDAARRARTCGIVFQSPTLMEWRTIAHNIELPLEIVGAPRAERAQRSQELLDLIRLRDFAARYPRELSAGMQMQVAIARALAYRPSILLLDEPFGALDEITRERLGNELLDMWERTQVTIAFVTHSVGEAVRLSDRVAVMSARPGHIENIIRMDLPRPRPADIRALPRYFELLREVRAALHLTGNGNGKELV